MCENPGPSPKDPKVPPLDSSFDPDAPASAQGGLFGLDMAPADCAVRVLGVPFDATTSYRRGASLGPAAVLAASHQVDLFDPAQKSWPGGDGRPWRAGLHLEIDSEIAAWNREARPLAEGIIDKGGRIDSEPALQLNLKRVNDLGQRVNERVESWTTGVLEAGALPVILGGDHSVPLGAISAAAESRPELGILHLDAHADLREAYEGFRWSHASILHNVLELNAGVSRLLSVGLRDVGQGEVERIEASEGRIRAVYDHDWSAALLGRADLMAFAQERIEALPREVWLTVDIDGLEPALCPNTGTPVPGGLDWRSTLLWLEALVRSGKRVVGLDLCEVSPGLGAKSDEDSWDAIVGARLLYKMIGAALAANAD